MSTWLYQINPKLWSPERYRLQIWEGERWSWPVGNTRHRGKTPQAGDTVVFFYSPTGGKDSGFYGWAVIIEWYIDSTDPLTFRPTAPSDHLKMHPWWDDEASLLANKIRGAVKQGTLWIVPDNLVVPLRVGITSWIATNNTPMLKT